MNRLLLVIGCLVALNLSSVHARSLVFLGKSVDDWRQALNSSDASLRRSAAFALGRMGQDAQDAVPDLVSRLRDDDEKVRDMAASAIGDIARALKSDNGDAWQQSGGWLVKILKEDPSERVRRSTAYALGTFGPQAAGATKALTKALADSNASVRQNAAWALGRIGPDDRDAVADLCKCLRDKNALVRRDAATALGSMPKAGVRAGRPLIELVKSESDSVVKKMALDSLAHVAGPKQADAAKDLEPLLADKDPEIRFPAAIVLARIGAESAAVALPVLQAALKDSNNANRELAAASLSKLRRAAKPAMNDLASALNDESNTVPVRRNAALAISHIGPDAELVVPAVARALQRTQPDEVRYYAAEALSQIRYPDNRKALPAILDAINNDPHGEVRQKCVEALYGMDRSEFKNSGADGVLTKLLDERNRKMAMARYAAARKLAQVLNDEAPDKTADVLLEMYRDKDLHVYNGTNANVVGSGTEASAGRANVNADLGGDARFLAVRAMGWLGKKASERKDMVKAIRQAAKDPDANLRKTAQEVLTDLGLK
ncbi:MAG TPA: HEAT repeat domain-containing protein [Gemmataceae bacterium]|nr:HEAT repeat domain-containing protein [Gemmataceae bacterium]